MQALKIMSCITLLFILNSCSKDKEQITITGQILTDCSGNPFSNYQLSIWQTVNCISAGKPCSENYIINTDINGSFSLMIPKGLGLSIKGENLNLSFSQSDEDLNLGILYDRPTTSFVTRIKVNNPYQIGDTLFFNNKVINTLPAPLTDTTLPLVVDYYFNEYSNLYPSIDDSRVFINYKIKGINSNIVIEENLSFPIKICPSQIDTLTIEIN